MSLTVRESCSWCYVIGGVAGPFRAISTCRFDIGKRSRRRQLRHLRLSEVAETILVFHNDIRITVVNFTLTGRIDFRFIFLEVRTNVQLDNSKKNHYFIYRLLIEVVQWITDHFSKGFKTNSLQVLISQVIWYWA